MSEKEKDLRSSRSPEGSYVEWFREASPYIHRFRGETFVIVLDGELLREGRMLSLAHDIALLSSLGIRLVLVFGASPQIDATLHSHALSTDRVGGRRITPLDALGALMESVGRIRFEIEAALSQGTDGTPMAGARIRAVSGNFVIGRPLGVIGGVDFLYTGTVRRIESEAIRHHLDQGDVVLLSPLAFSPTGEVFNILSFEVASRTAVAIRASKILLLGKSPEIKNDRGEALRQLVLSEAKARDPKTLLPITVLYEALEQGVPRLHLLDGTRDGALLMELFTRDGVGTLISRDPFEHIRKATLDDLVDILAIIRPLEAEGVLVRRPRERIEMELDHFIVTCRDQTVIGCVELIPYPESSLAEMACLAILPEYQGAGRGEQLLAWCRAEAKRRGLERIFVLTTQSSRWFMERGFVKADPDLLPPGRRSPYDPERKSQVLVTKI
jgi:amino-acid N-acetyltransferase